MAIEPQIDGDELHRNPHGGNENDDNANDDGGCTFHGSDFRAGLKAIQL